MDILEQIRIKEEEQQASIDAVRKYDAEIQKFNQLRQEQVDRSVFIAGELNAFRSVYQVLVDIERQKEESVEETEASEESK